MVGDLDSIESEVLQYLRIRLPPSQLHYLHDQDSTDLEKCLQLLANDGQEQIVIAGGLGGNLGQTLSNLSVLFQAAERRYSHYDRLSKHWMVSLEELQQSELSRLHQQQPQITKPHLVMYADHQITQVLAPHMVHHLIVDPLFHGMLLCSFFFFAERLIQFCVLCVCGVACVKGKR